MSSKKPLKVGFDLDGVILYNPARIVRPMITTFKRLFLKKTKTSFYVPKTRWEEIFWELFHKSSIFIAPGFEDVKRMVKEGKIEAYLVTGRYHHLKPDLDKWLKKIGADEIFVAVYHNQHNQQPHLYKENMLRQLNLDYFIEDNWDIVTHLHQQKRRGKLKTEVFWIYNLLDKHVLYPHKFPVLAQAVKRVETIASRVVKKTK